MVDFIGIQRIRELIEQRGLGCFIEELAAEIEADFRRWGSFDKSRSSTSTGIPPTPPSG